MKASTAAYSSAPSPTEFLSHNLTTMDIFEDYLEKHNKNCRALTCKSYKKVYQKESCKKLADIETNYELATYGDALFNLALCHIFLDNCKNLSKTKEGYSKDEYLVKFVAKHYKLLDYMNFDKDDKLIPNNYDYIKKEKDNDSPHKYIATTVEAVLGTLFKDENKSFEEICALVKSWTKLKK